MKKSGTLKSVRARPGGQKDFHLEYRKSLKTKRGASIKEVPEAEDQNQDLEQGARGKKVTPRKGPITSVTINQLHYGVSSTLPAPELQA